MVYQSFLRVLTANETWYKLTGLLSYLICQDDRVCVTSYFCPVNIAKFLRTVFLKITSRNRPLQMFFKIGALKSLANLTGKHLYWSLFLKNLHAKTSTQVFFREVCEIFKNTFFIELLGWLLMHLRWLLLYFLKKKSN